jgi:hypothetical protein
VTLNPVGLNLIPLSHREQGISVGNVSRFGCKGAGISGKRAKASHLKRSWVHTTPRKK